MIRINVFYGTESTTGKIQDITLRYPEIQYNPQDIYKTLLETIQVYDYNGKDINIVMMSPIVLYATEIISVKQICKLKNTEVKNPKEAEECENFEYKNKI